MKIPNILMIILIAWLTQNSYAYTADHQTEVVAGSVDLLSVDFSAGAAIKLDG